jgi:hypothetical protein
VVADIRTCEQCGVAFEPRREHARFCSPRCRAAWNRENTSDWKAGASALGWSITAMRDTTQRLDQVRAGDRPQAFAVIGEAVWRVTIVDATLVRYHPEAYDSALAARAPGQRRLTEGTFAGLRFVRNRMGYLADPAEFIQPREIAGGAADACITTWAWKSLPQPALGSLPRRGQAWEMERYRAYQAHLAGHRIVGTFARAAAFLEAACAKSSPAGDLTANGAP